MNRLFQRTPAAPAPEPEPLPTHIRVAHDGERVIRTVPYASVAEWQAKGYSQVPPGIVPHYADAPYRNADTEPEPENRDLFAPMANIAASSQAGIWDARESLARKALDAAADQLARYVGRPRIPREALGIARRDANPVRAGDLAQNAITAEAVVKLAAEVDRLSVQVAALQNAAGK